MLVFEDRRKTENQEEKTSKAKKRSNSKLNLPVSIKFEVGSWFK